jgi:spermidine/putrescine transport system ATP-binding protein
VALARALAVDPDILLLDEPLGALDLNLRRAMQDELKAIQHRLGTTFVHVTHDQEEAMAVADTIVVMRAGRIEDQGPPDEIYRRPRSLFSAAFMGEVNLLPGTVHEGDTVATALGPLALPAANLTRGAPVTLAIRPEQFRDGGSLALGSAVVEDLAFLGTHFRARCRVGETRLVAHFAQGAGLAVGATTSLAVEPAQVVLIPGHPE